MSRCASLAVYALPGVATRYLQLQRDGRVIKAKRSADRQMRIATDIFQIQLEQETSFG